MAPGGAARGSGSPPHALFLAVALCACLGSAAGQAVLPCSTTNTPGSALATINPLRAAHQATNLVWNATIAARAQSYANLCNYGHTIVGSEYRLDDGENIYMSWGTAYPSNGKDACAVATDWFYAEVASYNFSSPPTEGWGLAIDDGVIGHFTQLVWGDTTAFGCGAVTGCPAAKNPFGSADWEYIVCQYSPSGNWWGEYGANVQRTKCQLDTGDDWCSACDYSSGTAVCKGCFPRPRNTGTNNPAAITLDATTKRPAQAAIATSAQAAFAQTAAASAATSPAASPATSFTLPALSTTDATASIATSTSPTTTATSAPTYAAAVASPTHATLCVGQRRSRSPLTTHPTTFAAATAASATAVAPPPAEESSSPEASFPSSTTTQTASAPTASQAPATAAQASFPPSTAEASAQPSSASPSSPPSSTPPKAAPAAACKGPSAPNAAPTTADP